MGEDESDLGADSSSLICQDESLEGASRPVERGKLFGQSPNAATCKSSMIHKLTTLA
jgi:hypothetical protein